MKTRLIYFVGILGVILLTDTSFAQLPDNFPLTLNTSEQVECAVGINPQNIDEVVVAWNDYRNGSTSDMGWAITMDAGASWDSSFFDDGIDPSCGFDKYGNIFVSYYKKEVWGGSIKVAVTSNIGQDWVHKTVYSGVVDKPLMAIDNSGGQFDGRIYVAWQVIHYSGDYRTDSILFSYAEAADSEFVSPVIIETLPDNTIFHNIGWPMPSVGYNSKLYLTWARIIANGVISHDYDSSLVMLVTSTDGGDNFTDPDTVTEYTSEVSTMYFGGGTRVQAISMPIIAADIDGGVFVLIWNRVDYGNGNKRIKWFRSTDEGESWDSLGIIGDMGGGIQFFPTLTTSEDCATYVTYMHSPATTPGASDTAACFLIRSLDRGETFSKPIQVSDRYSKPNNSSQHHEYNWVAASKGRLYATWTDYRNQNSNIYISGHEIAQQSNTSSATAYGSTPKTLYSDSTERWNTVYVHDGKIHHTVSSDDGFTWDVDTIISASVGGITSTSNPALVEGENGMLHVIFASTGNGIYHIRKTINGAWSTPTKIYNASGTSYPTLITNHDTGHVVFVSYESGGGMIEGPGGNYKVYYGIFNINSSGSLNIRKQIYSSSASAVTGTSLAQFSNGQLHAVWSRSNEIYHSSGSGASWAAATNISNNNGSSVNPSIASFYGNTVRVAWQDNTSGNYDILTKSYYTSWSNEENISGNGGSSVNPSIMHSDYYGGVPLFVWSDNTSGDYNIWYHVYGSSVIELRSTPQTSNHPAVTERDNGDTTRFLFIWTEGSSSPYTIASSFADGPIYAPKNVLPTRISEIPGEFILGTNYPNPFNPGTHIRYNLPEDAVTELVIYNILGQEVARLVEGFKSAGSYGVKFDATDLPSGVYMYRLQAGKYSATRKLVLIR